MKKCLLITYVFPPSGGVGVQRALKFIKYLPQWGWEAVVVTPKTPSTPLKDVSYLKDLPADLRLHRLPTLEPSASIGQDTPIHTSPGGLAWARRLALDLLFPDRHVIWLATALPGTLAAARRHQAQAIMVTAPPFSTFLLGAAAARLLGLPLVLDFRDDWSGFFTRGFEAHTGGRLRQLMVAKLEGALVKKATRVIGNTPEMTQRLAQMHGGGQDKYVSIPNGYDPADFSFLEDQAAGGLTASSTPGCLHLLYAGTVFESRPLTSLWEGLERLSEAERRRITVEVVGRVVAGQVVAPKLPGLTVTAVSYEPHEAVLRRMAAADVLLLTAADLPGLNRMVPAKLFEYLAARRPILCLAPLGAASKIVEACGAGAVVPPGQPARLAGLLARWLKDPPAPLGPPPLRFSRVHLARELAEVLDQAILLGPSPA